MARPYALLRAGFPYLKTIGEFKRTIFPADLAIRRDGIIYSLGAGAPNYGKGKSGPIYVTNLNDDNLGSFGFRQDRHRPVSPACTTRFPCQIVLDAKQERIFITDNGADQVNIFSVDDHYPQYLGRWGQSGAGKGQINRPSGIALDAEDNVWVVDSENHRVQKFTADGKHLTSFGEHGTGDGQFVSPWGIHIDELGQIYIADWRNDRIQVFDQDGRFLWKFGSPGEGNGEFRRPAGVAVDSDGDIFVCDWGNNRVQLFTPEGRYVQQFRGDATLSKQTLERAFQRSAKQKRMRGDATVEQEKYFTRPRSVRVDQRGHMYVPDFEHYRIQIYKKEAYPLDETQILPPFKVPTLNAN
ncbi:MAG: 6-bladed beta-propeller [SAR202 cluster bacterium]|nr:6-bladed beta-propeller [SAR202 cluster bacterium]